MTVRRVYAFLQVSSYVIKLCDLCQIKFSFGKRRDEGEEHLSIRIDVSSCSQIQPQAACFLKVSLCFHLDWTNVRDHFSHGKSMIMWYASHLIRLQYVFHRLSKCRVRKCILNSNCFLG